MTGPEREFSLADRYRVEQGRVYLSGVQALVRLPVEQRRRDRERERRTAAFICGYEGSPLAGYDLELGRNRALLDEHGIVFRPGLNEELAAGAVQGTQLAALSGSRRYDGVTGYWYGKAPGLDRATDALRHANLGGTSPYGGALAIVGDDATAKSSTVPSSSEPALAELGMPTLVPADPQGILDLGLHGVAMSRFCGLWVGLKIATNVADGSASAEVSPDRVRIVTPDNAGAGGAEGSGQPYVHQVSAEFVQPKLAALERSMLGARLELARRYAAANGLNTIDAGGPDDRVGVVAAGSTYLDVRQALDRLGLTPDIARGRGIRLLRLGMVFPLDPATVAEFAEGLDEIIVVEEKRSFIEAAIKDVLYGRPGAPAVHGKYDAGGQVLLRADGDLGADAIADALSARLATRDGFADLADLGDLAERRPVPSSAAPVRRLLPIAPRTPFFCSGCPHNRSTEVPAGSLVGAGIGCHAMTMLLPAERVGDVIGLTQMGGEGSSWIGMEPFVETGHMFQNLGDGTFHHSGSLAVRAAIAAGSNVTFKLLYNSAVAMTGGQSPGNLSVPDITRLLAAEGVRQIVVTTEDTRRYRRVRLGPRTTVAHRDELPRVQERLARVPGVTVLIHDQECAAELRRKRKRGLAADPARRAFINERVCEGCGDCGAKSACLSVRPVTTEYGRKTEIHQDSCNKDFSCLDGDCPSFLSVIPAAGKARARTAPPSRSPLPPASPSPLPPLPPLPADSSAAPGVTGSDRFTVRITGIGGTGVVTVAQIVATAAAMSGRHVRALDQTGLAQKGGAVVSDLRISEAPTELSNKLARGECDLYLGCDVLVAASATCLHVADPARTTAVIATGEVPTGAMVIDTAARFPAPSRTLGEIAARTRPAAGRFVDAHQATATLFGDSQCANVFLLGVAHQLGALPIAAEFIERAMELNGVAVEANRQAFRRGRQLISAPADFDAALRAADGRPAAGGPEPSPAAPEPLADLIRRRAEELTLYQDASYAGEYTAFVDRLRTEEAARLPGSTAVTRAVAEHLFKLMAYKDEYEVARLSIDARLARDIERRFGAGATFSYRLHPPILRALGMKRKVGLGRWFRPVLVALHRLRRLRGTPFDPFGHTEVRRTERALVGEYRELVSRSVGRLGAGTVEHVTEIARLPDMIRGYEHIKLANVADYRAAAARLSAALERHEPAPA
jgi:indolepyruvate ferredoxin oxidoreductase